MTCQQSWRLRLKPLRPCSGTRVCWIWVGLGSHQITFYTFWLCPNLSHISHFVDPYRRPKNMLCALSCLWRAQHRYHSVTVDNCSRTWTLNLPLIYKHKPTQPHSNPANLGSQTGPKDSERMSMFVMWYKKVQMINILTSPFNQGLFVHQTISQ